MIRGETKSLPGVAGHKAKDDGVLAGRCSLYSSFHVFSLWLFFSLAMFSGFFSVFFFSHPLTLSVFFSLMFILVPLSLFLFPPGFSVFGFYLWFPVCGVLVFCWD